MELLYAVGTPHGGACALVASYAFPPGGVTISALGRNAAKQVERTICLYTPEGDFDEPITIIRYLCSKSEFKSILLGQEKNLEEQATINQWLSFCASKGFDVGATSDLIEFNSSLEKNTFLCGNNLTAADLVGMASVHKAIKKATAKELQVIKHVTRWYNHMQHLPGIDEQRIQDFPKIELPMTSPDDLIQAAKALGESKKDSQQKQQKKQQKQQQQQQQQGNADGVSDKKPPTDAAADSSSAAASDKKKNKKGSSQPAAAAAAAAAERPVDDPMRLDMRVGIIRKVWRHPEADKLYCEEIDFGSSLGTRCICSGLVDYISIDNLLNKKVIVLFNLKEKTLRGFNSHGMVLCANNKDQHLVQLLTPPHDTPIGERVIIKGLTGEPDDVLSTKKGKDTLALVSPFLKTKDDCVAYYKDMPFVTPQGVVRCESIKDGNIS